MAEILIQDLPEYFDQVQEQISEQSIESLLKDLAPYFVDGWYRRFSTQTNADGSPWSSDLVDTGELRSSFDMEVRDQKVIAGPQGERNEDVAAYNAERGNSVLGVDEELADIVINALDMLMYRAFGGV